MALTMQWLRLYAEAVDDAKLRLLAFEDRWHFIAILCCKAQGILDEQEPLLTRLVSLKLGLENKAFEEVIRRLYEVGLIDKTTYQPLAWSRRQFVSDQDPTAAERAKRYRDNRIKKRVTQTSRVTSRISHASRTEQNRAEQSRTEEASLSGCEPDVAPLETQAREVLAFLNEKTGKRFQPVGTNLKMIVCRLKEGYDVATLRAIVAVKRREWWDDAKMRQYLRPATLFNATKAAQYRGELPS